MTTEAEKLMLLAKRLRDIATSLTDEDTPIYPHHYPGLTTKTMGGPAMTQHRPHQYEGPRGIAEVEDEEEEDLE